MPFLDERASSQSINAQYSKFRCGESAPDNGTRAPRPVPADIATAIAEVTGADEAAIGSARFCP